MKQAEMAAGLGYPSVSGMLTAMSKVWGLGGSIFINFDGKECRFGQPGRGPKIEFMEQGEPNEVSANQLPDGTLSASVRLVKQGADTIGEEMEQSG